MIIVSGSGSCKFKKSVNRLRVGTALMLVIAPAGGAWAETDPMPVLSSAAPLLNLEPVVENGRQIYQSAQFARFVPLTAADMVAQIPGFVITQTSNDRGLGEASQNVLINGMRISGKGDDARQVLGRTPAKTVLRIEIADAGTFNISGLNGQVLNLVTQAGGLSGNYAWRPEFRDVYGPRLTNGEFNLATKWGKADLTVAFNNGDAFRGGTIGPEVNVDANGDPLFVRIQHDRISRDRPSLSVGYVRSSDSGSVLNAKGKFQLNRFRRNYFADRIEANADDFREEIRAKENEWNFEGSADYEFALAGGRLKLTGFHYYEHSPTRNEFGEIFEDGRPDSLSRFNRVANEGETVLRGEYKWTGGRNEWQVSLEGAKNFLDAESALFATDDAGGLNEIPLPNATSRVEEKRAQFNVSYNRPLSSRLTLQALVGGEYSRLSQTGANGLVRSFWRPKGFATLSWKASDRFDASLKLQRKVGQLNFFDFLASVDLRDGNDNAGNPELVPPQSWIGELELNRSLGASGSVKLKLLHESLTDVVDSIPIGVDGEAPGNLPGSARRSRAELNATLLLDKLGWKGAKFDISANAEHSRLTDPLLGNRRPFGNGLRYEYEINLRHDIPGSKIAWGANINDFRFSDFARLDFLSRFYGTKPQTVLFVQHKNVGGLKVTAQLLNLLGSKDGYFDRFYADRRDGPLERTARAAGRYGQIYRLNFSGSF